MHGKNNNNKIPYLGDVGNLGVQVECGVPTPAVGWPSGGTVKWHGSFEPSHPPLPCGAFSKEYWALMEPADSRCLYWLLCVLVTSDKQEPRAVWTSALPHSLTRCTPDPDVEGGVAEGERKTAREDVDGRAEALGLLLPTRHELHRTSFMLCLNNHVPSTKEQK